jgi:hypothetical protein
LYCKVPQEINSCNETTFTIPVTETEREVAKNFKGKYSVGIDEIPDYVVTKCTEAIKNLLAHTWNTSLESGAFPGRFKIAKVKLLHKKERRATCKITDQYPTYVGSQKS